MKDVWHEVRSRWHRVARRLGFRPRLELKTVLTKGDFTRELSRQQALADRTGFPFVLLRFRVSTSASEAGNPNDKAALLLAEIVRRRTRLSDIVGWCEADGESIGVMLHGARPEGAACLAHAITESFGEAAQQRASRTPCTPELNVETVIYPEGSWEVFARVPERLSNEPDAECSIPKEAKP